jgi:hypothetical protein
MSMPEVPQLSKNVLLESQARFGSEWSGVAVQTRRAFPVSRAAEIRSDLRVLQSGPPHHGRWSCELGCVRINITRI